MKSTRTQLQPCCIRRVSSGWRRRLRKRCHGGGAEVLTRLEVPDRSCSRSSQVLRKARLICSAWKVEIKHSSSRKDDHMTRSSDALQPPSLGLKVKVAPENRTWSDLQAGPDKEEGLTEEGPRQAWSCPQNLPPEPEPEPEPRVREQLEPPHPPDGALICCGPKHHICNQT